MFSSFKVAKGAKMIKSRFSRLIAPLAVTTALSGGMLVKSTLQEPEAKEEKIEHTTNPLDNPAAMGTLFALGLLGTAGAATLAKAVDVKHKAAPEFIEDIVDIATLKESDYKMAFEERCRELDEEGAQYDKEALRKQYRPRTKSEILNTITENEKNLERVTLSCSKDKKAAKQLYYLIDEIKCAVRYDKEIDDDIQEKMLYQFDKATTSAKAWKQKELEYKTKYPNVDFEKSYGITRTKEAEELLKAVIYSVAAEECKPNNAEKLDILETIQEHISKEPQILNKYEREHCLELIPQGLNLLKQGENLPNEMYKEILELYIWRQRVN